jgi:hypothetical protein
MSRRKMIAAAGATVLAPIILKADQPKEIDRSTFSISDREVVAMSSSHDEFGPTVEKLYPGLQEDTLFKQLTPLSILIRHNKGPNIRAHTISWEVTSPAGTYETALYSYISPGSASKGHSLSTLGSARRAVLSSGDSRLITPFSNWTPAQYKKLGSQKWNNPSKLIEPGGFLMSELSAAATVRVSLDAAVFSDWKLIGPDKHNLTRRLRSRRNAEHDEGMIVYKLLKSGATDSTIENTLQAHSAAQRSSKRSAPLRWYEQARRFQAQVLLRAFQDSDRETFTKAVTRLKNTKNTVITRIEI